MEPSPIVNAVTDCQKSCVSHMQGVLEPDGSPLTPAGRQKELTRFFLVSMVLVSLFGNVAYALHHATEVGAITTQCDQKTQKQRWEAETRWAAQARDHARVNSAHASLLNEHSKLKEKHSIVKRHHAAVNKTLKSKGDVQREYESRFARLQKDAERSKERETAAEAAAARAATDALAVRKEVVDLRAAREVLEKKLKNAMVMLAAAESAASSASDSSSSQKKAKAPKKKATEARDADTAAPPAGNNADDAPEHEASSSQKKKAKAPKKKAADDAAVEKTKTKKEDEHALLAV